MSYTSGLQVTCLLSGLAQADQQRNPPSCRCRGIYKTADVLEVVASVVSCVVRGFNESARQSGADCDILQYIDSMIVCQDRAKERGVPHVVVWVDLKKDYLSDRGLGWRWRPGFFWTTTSPRGSTALRKYTGGAQVSSLPC